MNIIEKDIVIIGAGLTGLTLAHNLQKKNKDFIVLDRAEKVGGVIQTMDKEGFKFELGPNTGVMGNEFVLQLFDELNGLCSMEIANDAVKKRYILKKGKWEAMPSGLMKGITTPLFSFGDKLRILGEPFRKPGIHPNETLDQLVIRRMGKSFLDYAIDPFILGVYAGDSSYLVPRFALPKLYNLEQKYGSFIGGHIKMAREKRLLGTKSPAKRHTFSAKGGLNNLVQALYLSAGRQHFLTGIENIVVKPLDNGFMVSGYNANMEALAIKANKVITVTGAYTLSEVLPFLQTEHLSVITNLIYAKVVQASIGFKSWKGLPLDGFGGLIPFKEHRNLLGVLYPSAFFPDRAPEAGALLSGFLGGVRKPELFDLSDDALATIVQTEICKVMGLKEFAPDVFQLSRYQHAIPQYGADCEARFAAIARVQKLYPGLYLAGNMRDGIGMADRIKQGFEIADSI